MIESVHLEVFVKSKMHKLVRYGLALGTLGYGVASMMRSQRFAEMTGMDEAAVRELAMRDIGSGLVLLTAENPTSPLMSRVLFDFSDGLKLLRIRPQIAPIAFAWGLLAIIALVTRSSHDPTPER